MTEASWCNKFQCLKAVLTIIWKSHRNDKQWVHSAAHCSGLIYQGHNHEIQYS